MCMDLGFPKSTTTELKMERTKSLSQQKLKLIADYFGVSVDYLVSEDNIPSIVRPVQLKKIPMLGRIACGQPIYTDEEYGVYVDATSNTDCDFCLTCVGDSMSGAEIYDGDVVFIKSMPLVPNGSIAAVQIGDEATLKKWEYFPEKNMLVLTPYNAEYATQIYHGEELNSIRCLGRAVSLQRRIR